MQGPDNQTPNQDVPQLTGEKTPSPGYAPGQTPTQGYVPGQTPVPGYAPGQTPVPGYAPGQTPAPGYVPGQTPAAGYVPGQTPAPDYVPGQTPAASYVPGQTPSPGYAPGQTPAPGYVPGQTPTQGYVPGQTPAPGYVPGQTPAPGYVPGQTPTQGYVPGQIPAPGHVPGHPASPSDDFTHVYQTGNFGTHFGKVNTTRGKRYVIAHGVLSLFMIVFTIAAAVMMKNYLTGGIKRPLLGVSWVCAVCDGLSVVAAVYFMWRLSTLAHPLSTLMVMRTFAAFSLTMNMFFFLIGLLSAIMKKEDFVELEDKEIGFLKAIYAIIAILMFLKIFSSTSFVFHWWNCCPSCPTACSCFAPYCIFEEGEELAPGVPNSAGVQKIVTVGTVAAATAQEMNRQ